MVALLDSAVRSGVSVNTANKYGVSALGFAAERGHFDIVRLLVERGADVNIVDSFYGSRPIDFALRGGHLDIAVYLLEHKSPGAVSVLNAAIRRSDAAAVKSGAWRPSRRTQPRWPAPVRLPRSRATPRLRRW